MGCPGLSMERVGSTGGDGVWDWERECWVIRHSLWNGV